MLVTVAREEAVEDSENPRSNLTQVPYICYPINFGKKSVLALLDSGSKVNTIHPIFAKKLGLSIKPIDIGVQKFDGITLNIFGIVVAAFLVTDKANQLRFFKKTFLVANVSPEIVFGILFFTFSSANIDFLGCEL